MAEITTSTTAAGFIPLYERLAHELKSHGVTIVFGLVSDDTVCFCAALDSMGVRFVGARHESQAVSMADGFAAATGGLGVAVIGRGPALANGFNGVYFSNTTANSVLVIAGEAPANAGVQHATGPDYKQIDFNQRRILEAAEIKTFVAKQAETAHQAMEEAVTHANGRRLAVLLLPKDIQEELVSIGSGSPATAEGPVDSPSRLTNTASIALAAGVINDSKKPIVLAGRGAFRAGAKQQLIQLAEMTGALLGTSLLGKDWFRGHPYNIGIIGEFSHSMARQQMQDCDCVIAVGASLNLHTMNMGESFPGVPIIQIDSDRNAIGRWSSVDVAIVGDAVVAVEALIDVVQQKPEADKPFHASTVLANLEKFDSSTDYSPLDTDRTLDARTAATVFDRLLPEDRNLIYDGGSFMCAIPFLGVQGPHKFKLTTDTYSIGLGFGNAIGFAAGRPDETNVLLVGDGAFTMTMGELETVIREDIPLVIVLMNDCAYSSELHVLRNHNLPESLSKFPDVDFADVAESLGYSAFIVRTKSELEALSDVLNAPEGPVFIEVKLNPEVSAVVNSH